MINIHLMTLQLDMEPCVSSSGAFGRLFRLVSIKHVQYIRAGDACYSFLQTPIDGCVGYRLQTKTWFCSKFHFGTTLAVPQDSMLGDSTEE